MWWEWGDQDKYVVKCTNAGKNEVFDPNLQFPTVDQKANNSFSIAFPKLSKCLGT